VHNARYNCSGGKTAKRRKMSLREACSAFFGDGGPLVGNNNNKHFTKGDQCLYVVGVLVVRKGR